MKELPSQMGGGWYSQKKVGWGWGLRWIYSQFWFKRKKGRGGLTRCDDIAWNQRYLRCKMSQKTGGTCTEMWSYSCKDIICIKCFKTWSGVHFVQSSLQIYYFKYKNIAKNGGGGALRTKFTIYYIQRYYFRYKTHWSKFNLKDRLLLYLLPNVYPIWSPFLIDIYSRG